MNRSILQSMVRQVEALALGSGTDAPGDDVLLARFLNDRDESAFGAILTRHGRLVWAVCRGILAHDADAEDAFQATFLALFRGAKRIRVVKSLAPWLHGTATKIAKKARQTAGRRNGREKKVAKREADSPHVPDSSWDSTFQAVHDEIAGLPATLRGAFVLCVLEGERHREAAVKLGVPIGTLSARVSRARQLLLDRLTSRGLAPGLAAAALALGSNTGPAAIPDAVLAATRIAAMNGFSTISTSITTLAISATEGTTMKVKLLAAAVMIGTAMTISTGGSLLNRADGQVPKPSPAPAANQAPAARANAAPPSASVPAAPTAAAPAAQPSAPTPLPPSAPPAVATTPAASPLQPPAANALPSTRYTPSSNPASLPISYYMVERPKTLQAFGELLRRKALEGWVYLGSETLENPTGKSPIVMTIFRFESAPKASNLRAENNVNFYEPTTGYTLRSDNNGTYYQPTTEYAPRSVSVPNESPNVALSRMAPSTTTPGLPAPNPYAAPVVTFPHPVPSKTVYPTPSNIPPSPAAETESMIPNSETPNLPPPVRWNEPADIPRENVPTAIQQEIPSGGVSYPNPLSPTPTNANHTSVSQNRDSAPQKSLIEMYKNALRETKILKLDKTVSSEAVSQAMNVYLNDVEPGLQVKVERNMANGTNAIKVEGPPKGIAKVEKMILKLEKEILDSQMAEIKRP